MVIHHKFIKLIIKSVIMINIMIINITMRLVTGVNLQPPSPCQPASPNLPTSLLQINRLCVIVIVIGRDALIEGKWDYVGIFFSPIEGHKLLIWELLWTVPKTQQ